ncbi:MAG: MFS transporter [Litoricolaceae bacterium]|mgnify:FL=1|nr:MFS transporter [Litorivicinaceae bacterium]
MRHTKEDWVKANRAVATIFAIAGAVFGSWASRIPSLKNQLGIEPAELGGVLLVLAMASVLSFPISGRWIDIYGPAKVTRYLALSTLITLVLISFATSLWGLALCVAFFGASLGALDVSMNGWGAEIERQGSKSIMSSLHAYWSLFAGLGGAFGFAAIHFELSVLEHFMIVGLFMGVLAIPSSRVNWGGSAIQEGSPVFAWPKKHLLFVGFLMFGAALAEGAVADWAAIFVIERFHITEAIALSSFVIFSFAMFVSRMFADGLVDRYGAVSVCCIGGCLATAGIGMILLVPDFRIALMGFLLLGLGLAPVFPLGCARAANDSHVTPGQGLASVATLGYGGIMLGPAVIGFAAQHLGIFYGFSLILLCGLYQLFFSWSLKKSDSGSTCLN